ncbi:hypothetical protein OS189_07970 [Sulfitobacter sp. F26169L]|uniref:hypothetical protein n=1 Tax=Sulfitobacter sp. F26169L TaxID=2996015 RepID=UPI002260AA32|nr:hypothetical protein [Sulfitobacter sp. F26169L]MCX7566277.1 hypothetical protein [Sulfitobacter sp. F26169L]
MKCITTPLTAITAALTLSACAQLGSGQPEDSVAPVAEADASQAEVAAVNADPVLTSAPPPPKAAKTQEALDTTTSAQRAQAAAPAAPAASSKLLGTTVASLGSPTEPGFWLKTPLVKTETSGRVTNKANGKSSAVKLIPIDGPASGGSRISLPAMRLIEAPLTELAQLEVTLGS